MIAKTLLIAGSLALASASLNAAIVVQYDIPGPSSTASASTARGATLTTPAMTGSGGFLFSATSGTAYITYADATSTLDGALTGQDFLQFSFTVPAGTVVNLSDLNLGFRSEDGATPVNFSLFATIGSFSTPPLAASALGTVSTTSNAVGNNQTIAISSPTFQNLTNTTVTLRLYTYDVDSATAAYIRVDNVTLNGAVIVPEPSALLLGLIATPLLFRRKRA